MVVVKSYDDDWAYGSVNDSSPGWFPSSYVGLPPADTSVATASRLREQLKQLSNLSPNARGGANAFRTLSAIILDNLERQGLWWSASTVMHPALRRQRMKSLAGHLNITPAR
jgi:hypothetical protein